MSPGLSVIMSGPPGEVAIDRKIDDRCALPDHLRSDTTIGAGLGNALERGPPVRPGGGFLHCPGARARAASVVIHHPDHRARRRFEGLHRAVGTRRQVRPPSSVWNRAGPNR
jgi:hypothetical protein